MPSTDRLSNIARARVSAVVLDEASGRERAATEVFNKIDTDESGTITKQEFAVAGGDGRRARWRRSRRWAAVALLAFAVPGHAVPGARR